MAVYSFDGDDLKTMLRGAVDLLEQTKEEIDSLNVFPVPDGDTGTNMYQTLSSALKEALGIESNHIGLVAEACARGGLIGARGNSGVILSQVLQGFALSLHSKENASAADISDALENGTQMAYRAVMIPVEGTILTVVKKSAEGAANRHSRDLLRVMVAVMKSAITALQKTPDLLPVLKQAGVVDAGGKGFVTILEGALQALKSASPTAKTPSPKPTARTASRVQGLLDFQSSAQSLSFNYCTELIIKGNNLPGDTIKAQLFPFGDSLMVVGDTSTIKVHIHSNHPGLVLECCLKYGSLSDLKINNMSEQYNEFISEDKKNEPGKPFAIISVGAGEGISSIMKNLGADTVLAGGQTFNPSTGEFLEIAAQVPSSKVIILPNNKNIILAAEQARGLSPKEITVIPARSIPQGISALLSLNPDNDFNTTVHKMKEALSAVRTVEVTRAVRNTTYNDMVIKKGQLIGLVDGDLITAGDDMSKVFNDILKKIVEGSGNLVTVYYGENVNINEIEVLLETARVKYSGNDFELQKGGQPVYDLIISVE
ncbi:MAG: DAK2 domain-containing protein [Desulfotomaculaceae bacterium]